jgi:glycerophosphoryl diester phosphodiesterase
MNISFLCNSKNICALILIISILSCKDKYSSFNGKKISLYERIENLKVANGNDIFIIAHRGDWRNAPENSLQAIENCIKMGVDIVEIDVHKTKDNQLVVIHDETLNRTTTGKGKISEWTLDSLKTIYLRNGAGHPTHHKIPTLEEALLTAKGKILINLDKCYEYFDQVYAIMKRTETVNQVIIKAFDKTYLEVRNDLGIKLDSIIFMPVINLDKQKNAWAIIQRYQKESKPTAFEIVFSKDTSQVLNRIEQIKNNGSRVWVNSLWESLNAGYEDDIALTHTDSIYGWYVDKGINMIQTDRPELLLNYLKSKDLHN